MKYVLMLLAVCFLSGCATKSVKLAKSNTAVSWLAEVRVQESKVADFKKLINKMCKEVRLSETGTLNYEWYEGKDNTFYIYERYKDNEAAQTHLKWFRDNYGKQMVSMFDLEKMPRVFITHGTSTAATQKLLKSVIPSEHIFTKPIDGFSRD